MRRKSCGRGHHWKSAAESWYRRPRPNRKVKKTPTGKAGLNHSKGRPRPILTRDHHGRGQTTDEPRCRPRHVIVPAAIQGGRAAAARRALPGPIWAAARHAASTRCASSRKSIGTLMPRPPHTEESGARRKP